MKKCLIALLPLLGCASEEYVIGAIFGQMGNNLFQVATASALAWDHEATAYFPTLAHTPILCHHVFSRVPLFPPSDEISVEFTETGYRYQPIFYQPKMRIDGYFQSYKYFAHYRERLLKLFEPAPKDLQYIEKKYAWVLEHPNTVGIQIRYYGGAPTIVQYGRAYLEKAMHEFPPDALFIVSSNDLDFAKEHLAGKKVFFLEDEPFYIDFYLLTFCKNIIITNSTFGWWAAWLNQNPQKKILCPLLFFEGVDTSDLCPEEWIGIDAPREKTP